MKPVLTPKEANDLMRDAGDDTSLETFKRGLRQGKEAAAVSRYAIKHTGPNWYILIDKVTGLTELQTTRFGMEVYAKIFGVKMPKEVSEK